MEILLILLNVEEFEYIIFWFSGLDFKTSHNQELSNEYNVWFK